MEAQTETSKANKYRVPPPKPRIAPGQGESPMLAVRLGADRLEKVKRLAANTGKTPAEFMRWLIDSLN